MMTRIAFIGALVLLGTVPAAPVRGHPGLSPRQSEPIVRIGLDQNAQTVTLRSDTPFVIQQNQTRTAKFSVVLAVNPNAPVRAYTRSELEYRMAVELDGGAVLVLPMSTRVRAESSRPFQFDDRRYSGTMEIVGNPRNTLTVVNELPLETYLRGVVPNELSPRTFSQIEALKAQAVAARTYIVRNMGQYKSEGYDICDTDACQVYFGAGTEDPLSSQAVAETSGMIAVYNDQPINALYSSTCGGRTENAENIFEEKMPYLVSTICEYNHPEPLRFSSTGFLPDWKQGVLAVAEVSNFSDARRFMSLSGQGEPDSLDLDALAPFLRQNFYPDVRTVSDVEFVTSQGILPPAGRLPAEEVLFRLIEKKGAFEWQQGILESWDGSTMKVVINGQPREFRLAPDALIYQRIGDERVAMKEGAWIGGELMDFRAVDGTIQFLTFRLNFASPSSDRYSRLALWQVHKTRQELDAAFRPLGIGDLRDIRVLERGPSERPISTEVIGSSGSRVVRALRIRSLLGLRDSLFHFDEERNSRGEIIGMTFFGRGWGHGVGMCQVGAYGMALAGAGYQEILKKYYTGIELKKLY
jgi:stage II sporulation protein D